jgi:hypothetical protein
MMENMLQKANDIKVWIAQAEMLVGISIDPKVFSDGLNVPGVPDGYKHIVFNAEQLRTFIAELQDRLIQIE